MNRLRLALLWSRNQWPVATGLAACCIGAALWLHSQALTSQAAALSQQLESGRLGGQAQTPSVQLAAETLGRGSPISFPTSEAQSADLGRMFEIAAAANVRIGRVDYRVDQVTPLQLVVRTADVQIADSYPKVKQVLAELLRAVPNCFLEELRVERKDVKSAQGVVTLRLAFVYRDPAPVRTLGGKP